MTAHENSQGNRVPPKPGEVPGILQDWGFNVVKADAEGITVRGSHRDWIALLDRTVPDGH